MNSAPAAPVQQPPPDSAQKSRNDLLKNLKSTDTHYTSLFRNLVELKVKSATEEDDKGQPIPNAGPDLEFQKWWSFFYEAPCPISKPAPIKEPPADQLEVIEHCAEYSAKYGAEGERMLREQHVLDGAQGKYTFNLNFLNLHSPYHSFYQQQVKANQLALGYYPPAPLMTVELPPGFVHEDAPKTDMVAPVSLIDPCTSQSIHPVQSSVCFQIPASTTELTAHPSAVAALDDEAPGSFNTAVPTPPAPPRIQTDLQLERKEKKSATGKIAENAPRTGVRVVIAAREIEAGIELWRAVENEVANEGNDGADPVHDRKQKDVDLGADQARDQAQKSILGQVQNDEYDLVCARAVMSPRRRDDFKFSFPSQYEVTQVFMIRDDSLPVFLDSFLFRPFSTNVWVALLIMLFILVLLYTLFRFFEFRGTETRTKTKMRAAGRLLPLWVEWWLAISSILCTIDIIYTTFRPYTNRGGYLEKLFEPWNIYADVDLRYAEWDDLVTMATGRVMAIEVVMNLVTLILARRESRHTVLLAFTTSAFVFWKTFWYMVLYIRQPEGTREYIRPGTGWLAEFIVFWVADGFWCAVPLAVMVALWNRLARHEYEFVSTKDLA
ncbi:unnamed protein product, partial [Mesorhabditis spiculigera]